MATAVMQAATPHASRQQLFLSEKLLSAVDHSSPSGPSPHAVSPVMSPSQIPGPGGPRKGAQRPNVESTPQPSYARSRVDGGAAAAAMGGSPWKESWTDELFSVDITLPRGFDLASITGSGRNKETERVEVDTGTVITVEYRDKAASDPLSPGGGPGLSDFSVIICGDDERNVDEARSRIEGYLSAICPADTEVSVRTSTGGARELKLGDLSAVANDSCQLFDMELRLLQQDDDLSAKLAQELQRQEDQLECSIRESEKAGALLALQLQTEEESRLQSSRDARERAGEMLALRLQGEEEESEKQRLESLELSDAFFDQLPSSFVKCPGCKVPFEMLVDTSIMTPTTGVQELPRGATLDTLGAERHKSQCRFRCFNCTIEFCSGCSTEPYHYGFTCETWAHHLVAKRCRFCGDVAVEDECCGNTECVRYLSFACKDRLGCGHLSGGVADAALPCLELACTALREDTSSATADDWCMICYVAPLREAPSLMLGCKHVFHAECLKERLQVGRPGARLSFNFLDCPACNVRIQPAEAPYLAELIEPQVATEAEVKKKAVQRWRETGHAACRCCGREAVEGQCCDRSDCKDKQIAAASKTEEKDGAEEAEAEAKVAALAMRRFNYYPCSRCDSVFFGGEAECGDGPGHDSSNADNNADGGGDDDDDDDPPENFDSEELVCGACSSTGESKCAAHGIEFVEYKCRFCCKRGNVATFFCGGSTHFCSECHKKGWGATAQPCDRSTCMFGGKHPPGAINGKDEYSLGCGLCRNQKDR